MLPRVVVVTNYPSPYQVELFDALSQSGQVDLQVCYTHLCLHDRYWKQSPLQHASHIVNDANLDVAFQKLKQCDLAVFTHYRPSWVADALRQRHRAGQAWCFWGERPGASGWGWLGRWRRKWHLNALHCSRRPIWGIGEWAVDAWQAEFGTERPYFNVPYFSNLDRFTAASPAREPRKVKRLLYSGSLIPRKGVDLLAAACVRLLPRYPELAIDWVGTGSCEPALKKQLAAFSNRVHFHGFQQWDDLPRFYAQADVLCAPSRYDGWAMVVPEGLAAGLPVIATDRMGAAIDLIESGQNGWIVQAGSARAMEEGLQAAINVDSETYAAMSSRARDIANTHSLMTGVERWLAAMHASLKANA